MRRAAVVGCGDVSVVHLEAIAAVEGIELVAVCDSDTDRLAAASAQLGVPGFADHRTLLAQARPDVVHVCTPHDQHVPVALDCIAAGVHVVLEKPLAHTPEAAEDLLEAAAGSTSKIGVCFQNRYNATAQAARTLLDSGSLGRVIGASASVFWNRPPAYYAKRPWRGDRSRSGGGVMINQAIHTLDLLLWLLGDAEPVAGQLSRRLLNGRTDVEDTADLVLQHGSGARSVLFATVTNTVDSPVTLEIVTEQATLYLRGDLTVAYADGRTEVVRERVAASGGRAYWGVSHDLLIRDFYARLDESQPFWISPVEAAKSLAVIDHLYRLGMRSCERDARATGED